MFRAYRSRKSKIQYLKILEYLHMSFIKLPYLQYKFLYFLFFETTIMGNTADWQWSRRQSLTPSTKRVSDRRSLLKGVAVHRVLYQSILNAKLTGRKNLGRKRCTSNRDDRKLENTVKQSRFKHLGELKNVGWCISAVTLWLCCSFLVFQGN